MACHCGQALGLGEWPLELVVTGLEGMKEVTHLGLGGAALGRGRSRLEGQKIAMVNSKCRFTGQGAAGGS